MTTGILCGQWLLWYPSITTPPPNKSLQQNSTWTEVKQKRMGCCNTCVKVVEESQPNELSPWPRSRNEPSPQSEPGEITFPVPFGHVPYSPALPGVMGPLWDFPIEWWYYVGWATDKTGSKQFTLLLKTFRVSAQEDGVTVAGLLYGIGVHSPDSGENSFTTHWAPGVGRFPAPTPTSWSTAFEVYLSKDIMSMMTCKLTSGTLGLPGALYQLDMTDKTHKVAMSVSLRDTFGMVFEGASGAYNHASGSGKDSFEFAMPSMAIQEGGTITLDGTRFEISKGSLWLDRQTVAGPNGHGLKQALKQPGAGDSPQQQPLYTGNWLAVNIKKVWYMFAFFWPEKSQQWIVGTKLNPPVYPKSKIGLEYPALTHWDGYSPFQGVNVLPQDDFDLNILDPNNPTLSPHWTSKAGHCHTYCSAWQLRIRDEVYAVKVLVPESEVNLGLSSYFFEGAATVKDKSGDEVGHAFVEQMGYN